jgi:DNA-binding ferritin-like protein
LLENDLAMNRQISVKLREHSRLAGQLGDFATAYFLKKALN